MDLSRDVSRCLAYGMRVGETCRYADACQRHLAIRTDGPAVNVSVVYRACHTEQYECRIPVEGLAGLGEEAKEGGAE